MDLGDLFQFLIVVLVIIGSIGAHIAKSLSKKKTESVSGHQPQKGPVDVLSEIGEMMGVPVLEPEMKPPEQRIQKQEVEKIQQIPQPVVKKPSPKSRLAEAPSTTAEPETPVIHLERPQQLILYSEIIGPPLALRYRDRFLRR